MAGRARSCQAAAMSEGKEKAERLAAALRENLRKRKAQARDMDEGTSAPAEAAVQSGEAAKH